MFRVDLRFIIGTIWNIYIDLFFKSCDLVLEKNYLSYLFLIISYLALKWSYLGFIVVYFYDVVANLLFVSVDLLLKHGKLAIWAVSLSLELRYFKFKGVNLIKILCDLNFKVIILLKMMIIFMFLFFKLVF